MMTRRLVIGFVWTASLMVASVYAEESALIGHLPLQSDTKPALGEFSQAQIKGVKFLEQAAQFDGRSSMVSLHGPALKKFGTGDFSAALWIQVDDQIDDVPGDLLSVYDPASHRGWQLSLKSHDVTTSRVNHRTLHFGIDQDRIESDWTDHGQVGDALLIFAMTVHNGEFFVGTCERGADQSGRVFRFAGGTKWVDCGMPPGPNSVSALVVHKGQLYAGTAKYRLAGSALAESENTKLGGQIYRYERDGQWTDCGRLPETEAVSGITEFGGKLYASSLYRPAGFFRYDGDQQWTRLDVPNGKRVEAMGVYNGQLFASSYDEAHVFRFDGQKWTDCGQVGEPINTQTYSFTVYRGQLYVGTWSSGKVFRYDGDNQWVDCGQLASELEVMGMIVHNGRLLAGSLPLAGVYEFDGLRGWIDRGLVDRTPDVKFRRAWTMAEYNGRVFVGTLPSGRVLSNSVGVNVTYDRTFPTGWHHLVARRAGNRLQLLVDGKQVAESASFEPADYDLSVEAPLQIGFGMNDHFAGRMRDVRIYRAALSDADVAKLVSESTPPKDP